MSVWTRLNRPARGYVEFIRKIRRDAPRAWVFLLDSPMLYDEPAKVPKRTILHAYLQEIVTRLNSPQVLLAPVSHYQGTPGDGHPTRANHEAIAAELEPLFRQVLHW
jgi:hypothetical protein